MWGLPLFSAVRGFCCQAAIALLQQLRALHCPCLCIQFFLLPGKRLMQASSYWGESHQSPTRFPTYPAPPTHCDIWDNRQTGSWAGPLVIFITRKSSRWPKKIFPSAVPCPLSVYRTVYTVIRCRASNSFCKVSVDRLTSFHRICTTI